MWDWRDFLLLFNPSWADLRVARADTRAEDSEDESEAVAARIPLSTRIMRRSRSLVSSQERRDLGRYSSNLYTEFELETKTRRENRDVYRVQCRFLQLSPIQTS